MTWTPEQDAILRKLYARDDLPIEAVYARIGKCASAVHRRRVKLDIPPRTTTWPDHMVAELKRLWLADRLSCTEIGKAIGKSKNAVVGKAFREGLPSKKANTSNRQAPSQHIAAHPPAWIAPVVRSCAWPIGTPGKPGFYFCGGEVVEGKPYCKDHCKVAYVAYKLPNRAAVHNMEAIQ